jgi:hypothetical protein
MEKKLSDLLSALAIKTKAVETKIESAREVSGKLLDKKIEESKAELQQKKNEFISHAEAVNARTQKGWDSFRKDISQKVEHVKAEATEKKETFKKKVDEKKQELNVESAERQYNNAVAYAAFSIEWAAIALSEVESAMLETFKAKQKLNDLKEQVVHA